MNKPILLALSILLGLAALAGLWFVQTGTTGEAGPGTAAAPTALQPSAAAPTDVAEPGAPRSELGAAESARDAERERRTATLGEDLAVPVRVRLPAGVPTDERIEIVALAYPLARFGNVEAARAAAEQRASRREATTAMFGDVARSGERERDRPDERACEPDGSGGWIASFPRDTAVGLVELRARYVYANDAVTVDLVEPAPVEIETQLGAWLTGTLRAPPGTPAEFDPASLAGVPVNVVGWSMSGDGSAAASAELADDMTFAAGGLRPDLNYFLSIDPKVFVPVGEMQLSVGAGEHVERTYDLELGATLRGRVVDAQGLGVAEASVRADVEGAARNWMVGGQGRRDRTDADGRFELRAVSAGKATLRASKAEYVESPALELQLENGATADALTLELGTGFVVRGHVLWPDGTPAAGADVSFEQTASTPRRGRAWNRRVEGGTHTDEQGHFERSGFARGQVDVRASISRAIGEFAAVWQGVFENATAQSEVEIVLVEPLPIRGRVVDDAGRPVPEFEVAAEPQGEAPSFTRGRNQAFEREDGRFAVFVQPARFEVSVTAKGYAASETETVEVPGTAELEFVLRRVGSVRGVVLSPLGAPVPGAKVAPRAESSFMMGWGGDEQSAVADADGNFELEAVPPGAITLVARDDEWAHGEPVTVTVEPDRPTEGVVLTVRVGGRIEGEIYDSRGSPDPERQIMIGNFGPGRGEFGGTTKSDAQGRFFLEHVAPGKYNVMATPRFDQMRGGGEDIDEAELFSQLKMTSVDVVDGQTVHVVLGAPPANPVRIFGRVTQGGQPRQSGTVMVMAEGGSMLSSLKAAKIGGDGSYSLVLDKPGDHTFVVGQRMGDDDAVEFSETIPEVAEHQLDFALPTGGIRGRVFDAAGAPVAGISVSVERDGRASIFAIDAGRNASTDDDGLYSFQNLRAGTYTLRAGGSRFAFASESSRYGIAVRRGVLVPEGKFAEGIELVVATPGRLTGRVRDPAGQPVAGATIYVREVSGAVLNPMSSCTSDADGRFEFKQAVEGSYTLHARKEGLVSAESAALRVVPDGKSEVELQLQTGTMLKLTVEDSEGKSVRAELSVVDDAGREYANLSSMETMQSVLSEGFSSTERRIGPLAPGKYRVIATGQNGESASKPLTLSGQEERSMRVRLKD